MTSQPTNNTDKPTEILKRLLANVDDSMEFVGSAFNPKEKARKKVSKNLSDAEQAIHHYAQKMVLAARIEAYETAKYIVEHQPNLLERIHGADGLAIEVNGKRHFVAHPKVNLKPVPLLEELIKQEKINESNLQ